jgi:acyl-homoserine lactone synthase
MRMVEIHIVQRENRHLYEQYFDEYHRQRHEIYVKQRKWMDLDRPDGREIDQFDTGEAVYLFCLQDGNLIGSMRAVPTLGPTLMSDIFPYLNVRGPISRSDVYELSRIFVLPAWRGERAGPSVESLLLAAIMEYGLGVGLTGFTIVLETWWLPRFERYGWKARPLGLPQEIDGMSVLAVFVDCDDETWLTVCERRQVEGPVLTWNGLNALARRDLPLDLPAA